MKDLILDILAVIIVLVIFSCIVIPIWKVVVSVVLGTIAFLLTIWSIGRIFKRFDK